MRRQRDRVRANDGVPSGVDADVINRNRIAASLHEKKSRKPASD